MNLFVAFSKYPSSLSLKLFCVPVARNLGIPLLSAIVFNYVILSGASISSCFGQASLNYLLRT